MNLKKWERNYTFDCQINLKKLLVCQMIPLKIREIKWRELIYKK